MAHAYTSPGPKTATLAITLKLPVNVVLTKPKTGQTVATSSQVLTATLQAITDHVNRPVAVTDQSLVLTALIYAPKEAPFLAQGALQDLKNDLVLTPTARQNQASAIVASVMTKTLTGNKTLFPGGVVNKADGAALVTSLSINAIGGTSADSTLLKSVVTAAVRSAANVGIGNTNNGAAGVVTGAISQLAGVSNVNIDDSLTTNDFLVKTVITAAVQAARTRVLDITQAAAYAFASTYLKTTASGQVSAVTFYTNNSTGFLTAIVQGLASVNGATINQIQDQIRTGIALAYAGLPGAGVKGVNNFAYNNGSGTPVTDVGGL